MGTCVITADPEPVADAVASTRLVNSSDTAAADKVPAVRPGQVVVMGAAGHIQYCPAANKGSAAGGVHHTLHRIGAVDILRAVDPAVVPVVRGREFIIRPPARPHGSLR